MSIAHSKTGRRNEVMKVIITEKAQCFCAPDMFALNEFRKTGIRTPRICPYLLAEGEFEDIGCAIDEYGHVSLKSICDAIIEKRNPSNCPLPDAKEE